jgi:hypothetical protein
LNYDINAISKEFLINENDFKNWIDDLQRNKIFSDSNTLIHGIVMLKKIISKNNFFEIFDKNLGILNEDQLSYIKSFINETHISPENYELIGLLNNNFKSHINYTKEKLYSINNFTKLNLINNNNQLEDLFIQCLIQRVNKNRRSAIKNGKNQDPFNENNNIKEKTGLLISQRYLKDFYNLKNNDSYINILNVIPFEKLDQFVEVMISKTISLKKYILKNINLIHYTRRDIVTQKIKL